MLCYRCYLRVCTLLVGLYLPFGHVSSMVYYVMRTAFSDAFPSTELQLVNGCRCLQIAGFLCLPLGTRARLSKLRRCARLNEAPDTWPRLQWQIEIQCFLLLSLGSASAAFMALLDQNTSHTGQAILYGLRSYVWV